MKWKNHIIVLILFCLVVFGAGMLSAQEAGKVFEKALYLEESEGDLNKAIALYEKIVKDYGNEPEIAAKAQLHIGLCYEKLGKTEAVKAYETVIIRFAGQADVVDQARNRLAALRREEPAGLTMTRILPPEIFMDCQTLSPDGTKVAGIVFDMPEVEGQNLAIYDLATRKTELITKYDWSKGSRYTYVPVWSPDGTEVAFHAGGFETSARELWISNLAGESHMLLENFHGGLAPCDWLPDGSAVVTILENEDKTYSLGLISVKEGSFREVCPLLRSYNRGGDLGQAAAGGTADASPDGHFIAFADGPPDSGQDIYIISVNGGSKMPMTDHPADDREPRWSPDGRDIVFLSDRHGSLALWGVAVRDGKPTGEPFMILEGMQNSGLASWTKKGLISRTTVAIQDIYTLGIDPQSHELRGKPRIVDFTPSGSNYWPLWSPDGKHLAFFSPWRLPSPMNSQDSGDNYVIVMPSVGKDAKKFKIPTRWWHCRWLSNNSGLGFMGFSDDQRRYYHGLELETGNWNTRPIPTEGNSGEESSGAWSDEEKVIFFVNQSNPGRDGSEPGVYAFDPEKGQKRYIIRTKEGESLPPSLLSVSRDNKRLAMGWNGKIALIDVDTGQVERLEFKKEKLGFPVWSPDGKFLVASGISGEGQELNELFIVSLADGKVKSLDISRYLPRKAQLRLSPDWSPDGGNIAFGTMLWKSETNLIENIIPVK